MVGKIRKTLFYVILKQIFVKTHLGFYVLKS